MESGGSDDILGQLDGLARLQNRVVNPRPRGRQPRLPAPVRAPAQGGGGSSSSSSLALGGGPGIADFDDLQALAGEAPVTEARRTLARNFVESHKALARKRAEAKAEKRPTIDQANTSLRQEAAITHEEAGVAPPKGHDKRTQRVRAIAEAAFSPASPGAFGATVGIHPNTIKADQVVVAGCILQSQKNILDRHLEASRCVAKLKLLSTGLGLGQGWTQGRMVCGPCINLLKLFWLLCLFAHRGLL
jgi:hypothetical protein